MSRDLIVHFKKPLLMAFNKTHPALAIQMIAEGFFPDPAYRNLYEGNGKLFWTDGRLYRERRYPKIWIEFNNGENIRLVETIISGHIIYCNAKDDKPDIDNFSFDQGANDFIPYTEAKGLKIGDLVFIRKLF